MASDHISGRGWPRQGSSSSTIAARSYVPHEVDVVSEHTLVPGPDAALEEIRFDDWLRQSDAPKPAADLPTAA